MFFRQYDHEAVRLQAAGISGVSRCLQQYRDERGALLRNKPDLQINFGKGLTASKLVLRAFFICAGKTLTHM
jgi:hypothetical protein